MRGYREMQGRCTPQARRSAQTPRAPAQQQPTTTGHTTHQHNEQSQLFSPDDMDNLLLE